MIIVTSPDFKSGGLIPQTFTCQGSNIPPTLIINQIPSVTQSLALVMDDPDASGGLFTHWLIWNIDPATTEITSGSKPKDSVIGLNSAGANKYLGPCPPTGTHRYFFKIYALDSKINLPPESTVSQFTPLLYRHKLDFGQILGIYQKPLI